MNYYSNIKDGFLVWKESMEEKLVEIKLFDGENIILCFRLI